MQYFTNSLITNYFKDTDIEMKEYHSNIVNHLYIMF
jgi:hypothetical protein